MPKSVVAGVAGSVRLLRLDKEGLRKAELHAKRLDATGQMRQISKQRPVTFSIASDPSRDLDLQHLYQEHLGDVIPPQGNTLCLHAFLQFPTKLVDASDPDLMLVHATMFCERVFGNESVFAARVDQDEKGQHGVDVFLAPIYVKKTKLQSRRAISISRHLKQLAISNGTLDEINEERRQQNEKSPDQPPKPMIREPGLFIQGRALQTEFYRFLRDDLALEGVKRGSLKRGRNSDWMPAEVLDIERRQEALAELEATTEDRTAEIIQRAEKEAKRMTEAADALRRQAQVKLQDAEKAEALMLKDRQAINSERLVLGRQRDELAFQHAAMKRREQQLSALESAVSAREAAVIANEKKAAAKMAEATAAFEQAQQGCHAIVLEASKDRATAKTDRETADATLKKVRELQEQATQDRKLAEEDRAKAQAAAEEATMIREGTLLAVRLWIEKKLNAVVKLVEGKQTWGWEWRDKDAEMSFKGSVLAAGRVAWEVVRAVARLVASEVERRLTPEERDRAAAKSLRSIDVYRVLAAQTADEAVKQAEDIAKRAMEGTGQETRTTTLDEQAAIRIRKAWETRKSRS
jgi:hypothetical protein